jgi:hypothetical protein
MNLRLAVALLAGIAFYACGHDGVTAASPPVDAAGTWYVGMNLRVVRLADGYRAELWCSGTATLTQEPGTGALYGAVRYSYRCADDAELRGRVNAAGKIAFTMDGFRPYQPADSPCPGAKDVGFAGDLSKSGATRIYATGATRVTCGVLGDHDFTYTFDGWRNP